MKSISLILIFLLMIATLFAKNQLDRSQKEMTAIGDLDTMQINNIYLPYENDGSTADDGNAFYPNGTNLSFLFQGGIATSGYVGGILRASWMAKASLIAEWQPGNWGTDPLDPKAIFYTVRSSSPQGGFEYQNWADAVSLGADFQDVDGNGSYDPTIDRPDLLGNRTSWCVINDGTPMSIRNNGLQTDPMGLELYQQTWAESSLNGLENTIFFRYRLINTGNDSISDFIFSLWEDPDIGDSYDDLIGCDTLLNMGYCYNDGYDGQYGTRPPAFGVDLFQGPVVDSPGDTAFIFRGDWFGVDTLIGKRNLGMTAFTFYNNAIPPDPFPSPRQNAPLARLYQVGGFDGNGNPINPVNHGVGGQPTDPPEFFYTGDPELQTGWRDAYATDKRFIVNSGPFDLPIWNDANGNGKGDPGEPGVQDIIIGYLVGRGNNAANSVTELKQIDQVVQNYISGNFQFVDIAHSPAGNVEKFNLQQNFPNPFNPSTTIEFDLPKTSKVTLKIFNVLGEEITTLLSASLLSGSQSVEWDAGNHASGVYLYRLQTGEYVETRKMILMK